jgi:hypothetical protein
MVWALGSGDFVSGYSYHISVRTGLPDHTMQTKFQSLRPSDVETPVPSIWVQKWSSIGTPYGFVFILSPRKKLRSWWLPMHWINSSRCDTTLVAYQCCITSWGIDPMHCTTPALLSPSQWRLALYSRNSSTKIEFVSDDLNYYYYPTINVFHSETVICFAKYLLALFLK